MVDSFSRQKSAITEAVFNQLKQGNVVILSGEISVATEIYKSTKEKFNIMKPDDGSTAFYLKSEFLNPAN